jgi:tetraprenyl-beta-curcumene synthase
MLDEIIWAVRHVLGSRTRLRFLLADGPATPIDLLRFLRTIVPLAAAQLATIRARAVTIPDERLRREALASADAKAYHVAGGCILATFLPPDRARHYVEIVAPLETIYDYLDNLCDRHPEVAPEAYPVLHEAIADALDPRATPRDYYARGPIGDDGGYLRMLVERTQNGLRSLDGHELLLERFNEAARLYGQMQTFKHYRAGEREHACVEWFETHANGTAPGLDWHEFAAAAGSQFQVYAPLYELFTGNAHAIDNAYRAYFPDVAALHVLLDSFIDRDEDREHGELNFADLYAGERAFRERAAWMAGRARERFALLPNPSHHHFVLRVMTLFYLTHPKVYHQQLQRPARALLRAL